MTYLSMVLEIHQPIRLSQSFPFERLPRIAEGLSITDRYFDKKLNEEVFRKVARKCYYPTFSALSSMIETTKDWERPFKVSFGVSGPYLEQAIRYEPELIEMMKSLIRTGKVDILGNTYYHSLASLFPGDKREFVEQVREHQSIVKSSLGAETKIFENTEFIYNDTIAKVVESLGFEGILSEGVESILGWRSPTFLYSAMGTQNLRLLLRHYKLTDDIGFRFSQKSWVEYPLTADKYANWLTSTPGDMILLAMDIETFGEHHWVETGIFEFLKALPVEVSKLKDLTWATPREIVRNLAPLGIISVPEQKTISWADVEKDASAWLQNPMQRISFDRMAALEPYVREVSRKEVTDIWRLLQQSDHVYYMSTKSGGPGEVHSYFSPHSSAAEALVVFDSVLTDYEGRVGALVSENRKKKTAHDSDKSKEETKRAQTSHPKGSRK
ncbi:MAG: glycoside hydrolase family 57 protein [archaeon]|nr:glycoside hydrolase family 57 protein [archaeon]